MALAALEDNPAAPPAGSANLRIAHFAPFAPKLAGTGVDICNDATVTVLRGVMSVPFGVVSPSPVTPSGTYDCVIAVADGKRRSATLHSVAWERLSGTADEV